MTVEKLIAPPGSNLYYSLLFTEFSKKQAIVILHNFFHELESILNKCTSQEMALQRFQWWRGELHRIFNGTPEHPIGKLISSILSTYPLPKIIFTELLDGIERKWNINYYDDFGELIEDAHSSWSLLAILISHILEKTSKEAFLLARELGLCWLITRNIRRLPWDLHQQRILIPGILFKKNSVSPEDLKNVFTKNKKNLSCKKMLLDYLDYAKICYKRTIESTPEEIKKTQLSSIIFTELEFSLISILEKKEFSKKQYPLYINPLRKWWLSTRLKVRNN
ncbi:MAG: hypothetical protein A3I12_01865 [Gammaproteobacteria bacterium RIFCSPLOWO2_02_FULL_38_11]|nr:MAG: hypothetical protein A3I12_01865 [Gammaproteobacteria bacterium RIFCSPLOWO2_02_FULL_38_11]